MGRDKTTIEIHVVDKINQAKYGFSLRNMQMLQTVVVVEAVVVVSSGRNRAIAVVAAV